jgi:hypothetical protein
VGYAEAVRCRRHALCHPRQPRRWGGPNVRDPAQPVRPAPELWQYASARSQHAVIPCRRGETAAGKRPARGDRNEKNVQTTPQGRGSGFSGDFGFIPIYCSDSPQWARLGPAISARAHARAGGTWRVHPQGPTAPPCRHHQAALVGGQGEEEWAGWFDAPISRARVRSRTATATCAGCLPCRQAGRHRPLRRSGQRSRRACPPTDPAPRIRAPGSRPPGRPTQAGRRCGRRVRAHRPTDRAGAVDRCPARPSL